MTVFGNLLFILVQNILYKTWMCLGQTRRYREETHNYLFQETERVYIVKNYYCLVRLNG